MDDPREWPAVTVNGKAIALRDLLAHAFWHDGLRFIESAIDAEIVGAEAASRGIGASLEEVEAAATEFRIRRGLRKAADTRAWLAENGRTVEEWQAHLEDEIVATKLKAQLFAAEAASHFAAHKGEYDAATFSRILVADHETAEELWYRVHDDGADFHTLAREYSIDAATWPMGGYVGTVTRADLAPAVAAAVFGAHVGEVIGPIAADGGWLLVKVEEHHPATLTTELRDRIVAQLFASWLAQQRERAAITRQLLKPEAGEAGPQGDLFAAGPQVRHDNQPCLPRVELDLAS